ncbi:MAG: RsmB/NOP family class I SAM-dependent RNA methyltransferase [Desulfurococcales archaeon]|nr:RsmB/NOP family class I SAM-dependent RNA methyltransferase [Desulfurococcales archaeon]
MKERIKIKVLARVLYEVLNHRVSIDVAFKRACKGVKLKGTDEREYLYELARKFVSDYQKLQCVLGRTKSLSKLARAWLRGVSDEGLPPYCKLSYSKWFYDRVVSLLGKEEGEQLLASMNERVWWLRINTLKAPEERVLKLLESEGVEYAIDREYHFLLRIKKAPKPIRLLRPVKNYMAIPQDKASVAVVDVLSPEAGELIVDMAAAPGMKTSLIMMLTENRARIVAIDISYRRLLLMKNLLKKLGVDTSRVHLVASDSAKVKLPKFPDKVLLDAPCSNSGAVSKDPALKISLTEGKIGYYASKQAALLRSAIRLGRVVVYSVCSIMPEEGELVISLFKDKVTLEKALKWASTGYRGFPLSDKVMRLFPHKHLTEGFFIAKILAEGQ